MSSSSQPPPPASQPRTMLQDVISSVFEPGTNTGLVRAMNYSFYSLFLTLSGMVVLTRANVHVIAMLVLSVGLWGSLRWFLVQIAQVEQERKAQHEREQAETRVQSGDKGKTE